MGRTVPFRTIEYEFFKIKDLGALALAQKGLDQR
jgi:hypothetical protein